MDRLLKRPEYADYWALKWSDLLRVNRRELGHKRAFEYYKWIRDSFVENKPFDQFSIEIVAAQCRIAAGRQHLKHAGFEAQDTNIKCTATEIVYRKNALTFAIEAIGQRGSGRFGKQTQDVEACDSTCIFCCLALRIVKIGGYGNHRCRDWFAEQGFSSAFELTQNLGRYFNRTYMLAVAKIESNDWSGFIDKSVGMAKANLRWCSSHESFDADNHMFWMLGCLTTSAAADNRFVIGIRNNRGHQYFTVFIAKYFRRSTMRGDCHQAMRCAQVDTDHASCGRLVAQWVECRRRLSQDVVPRRCPAR